MNKKFAIQKVVKAIDFYRDFVSKTSFTINISIRSSPGGGKTWCIMYVLAYTIANGNAVITTALMYKGAIQLGGVHID